MSTCTNAYLSILHTSISIVLIFLICICLHVLMHTHQYYTLQLVLFFDISCIHMSTCTNSYSSRLYTIINKGITSSLPGDILP